MESPRRDAELADVLRYVLAAVERGVTVELHGSDDVDKNALAPAPKLSDELDTALRVSAGRVDAAHLAAALACTNRALRTAVDAVTGPEARAARVAHAQAMCDMASALRECKRDNPRVVQGVDELLLKWCLMDAAATALDNRYSGEASQPRKWRAFAREVVHCLKSLACTCRTMLQRAYLYGRNALKVAKLTIDMVDPISELGIEPDEEEDEFTQQAMELSQEEWRARILELLQINTPPA